MAEEKKVVDLKPKRIIEDITKEHNQTCAEAGWLQFRIQCDTQELQKKYIKISELNLEASDLKKDENVTQ